MKRKHILILTLPIGILFAMYFIATFILSLTNFDLFNAPQFIGFQNYVQMASDQLLFTVLSNTVRIYALTTIIVGSIALLLHISLQKRNKTFYYLIVALLITIALFMVSFVVARSVIIYLIVSFMGMIDHPLSLQIFLIFVPLAITLALLHLPWQRWHKSLRMIVAFVAPLFTVTLLERYFMRGFIITMDWSVLLSHLARDYAGVRLEVGYAAAIRVVHAMLLALIITIIVFTVLFTQKVWTNKISKKTIIE